MHTIPVLTLLLRVYKVVELPICFIKGVCDFFTMKPTDCYSSDFRRRPKKMAMSST